MAWILGSERAAELFLRAGRCFCKLIAFYHNVSSISVYNKGA